MTAFIPGRLQPIFGRDAWALDESSLVQLLDLPESDELDFKREPCGSGDSDKRYFAADVAPFANRAGGLIDVQGTEPGPTEHRPRRVGLLVRSALDVLAAMAMRTSSTVSSRSSIWMMACTLKRSLATAHASSTRSATSWAASA